MNNRNKIIFFFFSTVLVIGGYAYFEFNKRPYKDIETMYTDTFINSSELISLFMLNENSANSVYRNKVIEVEGIVKEVTFLNNRNTVLLQGSSTYSSVLCDMKDDQVEEIEKLRKGQKVKIKGVCKGFLKDVILLHCLLINTPINE